MSSLIRRRRTRPRLVRFAIAALVVTVGAIVMATFFGGSLLREHSNEDIWQKLSWRVKLFTLKLTGEVPEFSWNELLQMTQQQGGFGLEGMTRDGLSLEGSLLNPHVAQDDVSTGARIFREYCALCHGGEGSGGHGPALNHSGFKNGDSDMAIYKVLRDGVPDTPMVPVPLGFTQRWQVVGYLRALQLKNTESVQNEPAPLNIRVSAEQVLAAGSKTDEWLTYSGSVDGRRYSHLTDLTPSNVSQLRLRWVHQFDSSETKNEATPLVVNGVIFTTEPPSSVVALDVRSGNVIWRYDQNLPTDLPVCCTRVNRGLAILGNVLFWGRFDGYLVALDANSGKMIWQTRVANPSDGYTLTGAPLVANRLVVVGVAGGEFGIRGFLAAYDPETGKQVWKFMTVPGPGEPGHETWENDAWRTGGGPTWNTGSYDPSLDLLYWGVGNPAPDFSGDVRPGDNLFTDSVIALHASTGKLAWHFQFTPHDEHDWDSAQTPILADPLIDKTRNQVICWPNRNGFYYVLDRVTGRFLTGVPFVEQNWTEGLDSEGRPRLVKSISTSGELIRPGGLGGTNWQNSAYDEKRGMIFVPATEGAGIFTSSTNPKRGDRGNFEGSASTQQEPTLLVVRSLDATTGTKNWEHFSAQIERNPTQLQNADTYSAEDYSGLLATGGGLVFGAASGYAFALDSSTGNELWRVRLGGGTHAPPISFTLDGRQVILISAGHALFMFGLS
jgi:alcohol dehydrogenase (cytochrome c)